MVKNIAIIPARGGSKRLPGKNKLLLGGMPLLAHSIQYAQQNSEIIDQIYVSTDCADLKQISIDYGAEVIDRPSILADDNASTVSVLQHAVSQLGIDSANVILLQPTNPLRPVNLLKQCFEQHQIHGTSGVFTVSRSEHKLGRIDEKTFIPFNYTPGQRSQDLDPLYFENGLLYISTAECIRQGFIIKPDSIPVIIDHLYAQIDIDSQADFDYAEFIFNKYGTKK